ncbi:peptidoglycan-binding domain-containing protein [Streptomyces boninensis]|uniref:peptidoglycan-binding domain-containing protein n=1 Tax=Streptomyces boninensis TaxID=2039455 RepID=UPI003B20FD16
MNIWTKRGAAALATGILAVSLTACGGDSGDGGTKTDAGKPLGKPAAVKQVDGDGAMDDVTTQAGGNIGPGARGYRVRCVQEFMDSWKPTTVDGIYGKKTAASVRYYQGIKHISRDGIVGPVTAKKMRADAKKYGWGEWAGACNKYLP